MPFVGAMPPAEQGYERIIVAAGQGATAQLPEGGRRRRIVVAVAATAVGGLAAVAAALVGARAPTPPQGADGLVSLVKQDFRVYNPKAPGCLPMPPTAESYNGLEDKRDFPLDMTLDEVHVFAIGDWGALKDTHRTFECLPGSCNRQVDVAGAMEARAEWAKPQYVLNAGDSFYPGGIMVDCNTPPAAAMDPNGEAHAHFHSVWMDVYGSLAQIPWISTLGNHDYGGRMFQDGWSQLIGYSFVNHNWIMPSRWYNRKVQHRGFTVEYFVYDDNVHSAHAPEVHPDHNVCSNKYNAPGADCLANGGMSSVSDCQAWFLSTYNASKTWLEQRVRESSAHWKIVVTHYPCEMEGSFHMGLHERYGLDLVVTGHRHLQELWWPGAKAEYMRHFARADGSGLTCIVTGGGGGIQARSMPTDDCAHYGFFDLTISRQRLSVELVDHAGQVRTNYTIYKHERRALSTAPRGVRSGPQVV